MPWSDQPPSSGWSDEIHPASAPPKQPQESFLNRALDVLGVPKAPSKKLIDPTAITPFGQRLMQSPVPLFNALDIPRRANVAMYSSPGQERFNRYTGGLLTGPLLGANMAATMFGYNTPEQTMQRQAEELKRLHLPNNFWTQTGASIAGDPLSFSGPLFSTLHTAAEARLLPMAMRAGAKVSAMGKTGQGIAQMVEQAHNLLSVDPQVKRELAKEFAEQWIDHYATIYGVRGAIRSGRNKFVNILGSRFLNLVHDLKPADEARLYEAIDKNLVKDLTPELRVRAAGIKQLTDTVHYVEGDETAKMALLRQGFKLPDWVTPLLGGKPLKMATEKTYRGSTAGGYLPTVRGANAPTVGNRIINLLGEDPALLKRTGPVEAVTPQRQREIFLGRFGAAGTNVASGGAADIIHQTFGGRTPQAVAEFFTKEFEGINPMDAPKFWMTKLKQLQDVQKGSLFFLPFRHMANIISLGLMKNPAIILDTLKTYAQLNLKNLRPALLASRLRDIPRTTVTQEERYNLLHDAIESGAVPVRSEHLASEQSSSFTRGLQKTGETIQPKKISSPVDAARWLLAKPFQVAGKWYDFVGDQLWTFDDAIKAADFRKGVRSGLSPHRAAYETNAALVDYATRSQLAEQLAYIGPFTTWRTKAPVATLRNIMRNPGAYMGLSRVSPGFGGGMTDQPGSKGTTSSLPAAELNQLLGGGGQGMDLPGGLLKYGVGTLGYPTRLIGNAIINRLVNPFNKPVVAPNPLTYGVSNQEYIKSLIPGLAQYGQFHEGGLFPQTPLNALISSQTGYHVKTKPGLYKERPLDMLKRRYLDDHPGAKQKDLDAYVRDLKRFLPFQLRKVVGI